MNPAVQSLFVRVFPEKKRGLFLCTFGWGSRSFLYDKWQFSESVFLEVALLGTPFSCWATSMLVPIFCVENASHTNTRANKTEMDCQCKNGTLMLKEAKPLTKVQQEPTRKNNNPKVRKVKKKTQTKREIIKEQANAIKTITSVRKVTQKARESTKSHKKNLQKKAVNCKKGPRINSKRPRDQTG